MAGVIGAQIALIPAKNTSLAPFILIEVLLLSLSVRWLIVFSYPSILGVDPWVNWAFFADSINQGSLVSDYIYTSFPIFSSLSIQSMLVAGLPYKPALVASTGVMAAGALVFVYLIGARLGYPKLGLFSALLFSVEEFSVSFGSVSLIAMSLGIGLFSFLIYLLVTRDVSGNPRLAYLALFILAIIIMTHPLVSVIVSLVLISLFSGGRLLLSSRLRVQATSVTGGLTVLFFVGMVAYWLYVSNTTGFVVESFRYALSVARGDTLVPSGSLSETPTFEVFRTQLSQLVLLGLAIYGSLSILNRVHRSAWMLLFLGVSIVMWIIVSVSGIVTYDAILPDRWLVFAGFFLMFILGYGLVAFNRSHASLSRALVPVIVGVLAFALLTSPSATIQNPFYNKGHRFALLESETAAADLLSQHIAGPAAIDSYFLLYFQFYLRKSYAPIDDRFLNTTGVEPGWLVIVRTFVFDNELVFVRPDSTKLIGYADEKSVQGWKVKIALESTSMGRIYDSGTVHAYVG